MKAAAPRTPASSPLHCSSSLRNCDIYLISFSFFSYFIFLPFVRRSPAYLRAIDRTMSGRTDNREGENTIPSFHPAFFPFHHFKQLRRNVCRSVSSPRNKNSPNACRGLRSERKLWWLGQRLFFASRHFLRSARFHRFGQRVCE